MSRKECKSEVNLAGSLQSPLGACSTRLGKEVFRTVRCDCLPPLIFKRDVLVVDQVPRAAISRTMVQENCRTNRVLDRLRLRTDDDAGAKQSGTSRAYMVDMGHKYLCTRWGLKV